MKNFIIILNELGYSLRKHYDGYELRHIDIDNKHPKLSGKKNLLLPFYKENLESVALFIAKEIKNKNEVVA